MEQFKQSYKYVIKYTEELERINLLLIQTIKDILGKLLSCLIKSTMKLSNQSFSYF